jgi:hypothetical protein
VLPLATKGVAAGNQVRPREDLETTPGTDGNRRPRTHAEGMEILQILGTAAIVLGILVTVLIAIVPTVVDR